MYARLVAPVARLARLRLEVSSFLLAPRVFILFGTDLGFENLSAATTEGIRTRNWGVQGFKYHLASRTCAKARISIRESRSLSNQPSHGCSMRNILVCARFMDATTGLLRPPGSRILMRTVQSSVVDDLIL